MYQKCVRSVCQRLCVKCVRGVCLAVSVLRFEPDMVLCCVFFYDNVFNEMNAICLLAY